MTETFRLLDASIDAERREWERLWVSSAMRLPYANPGVVGRLELGRGDHLAAVMEWQDSHVLYPIVLRDAGNGLRDIASPYGYGGALVTGDGPRLPIGDRFWGHFDAWARDQRVVSEFVRLSLFPDVLPHPGRIRRRSTNYVRELPSARASLWEGSEAKVRQNVRRALRSGLTVRIAEDTSLLPDFERIYLGTMERLGSAPWYRFGTSSSPVSAGTTRGGSCSSPPSRTGFPSPWTFCCWVATPRTTSSAELISRPPGRGRTTWSR